MRMKWQKVLMGMTLVLLLLPLTGCAGKALAGIMEQPSPQVPESEALEQARSLRREVVLLNLINGLGLSQEQMEFILQKAQEAQSLREEYLTQGQQELQQSVEILQELRDTLMRGENIPDELKQRFREQEARNKEKVREYEDRMNELAEEVKGILEEHQLYALEGFVPCVIPPETGTRIGQAQSSVPGERLLARMRKMPGHKFEENKERIAQGLLDRLKAHLPPDYQLDEEAEKERLLTLLEEAYRMPDTDFNLKKEEILQELLEPYEVPRRPESVTQKIKRYLLDPSIIPLLEEKLGR